MRVKTEARRNAIIAAAAEIFRERGFDAASMGDIAARLGGSKATLYNYFPSKEELFAAVMFEAAKGHVGDTFRALHESKALEPALRRFANDYLSLMLEPDILALNRICMAEGGRTGISRVVYEKGVKVAWGLVAERLARAMEEGEIVQADPWVAAMHLKGLCDAGQVERCLRGCSAVPDKASIGALTTAGVDVFLRAYGAKQPVAAV